MKLPHAHLPFTQLPGGYQLDFTGLSHDLGIDGIRVIHGAATPLRGTPGHQDTARDWNRHEEEDRLDVLHSGILYYLSEHVAACKVGRADLREDGERSPCVLLTTAAAFRVTLHTDSTTLSIRHQGHTLCNFWFDDQAFTQYRPLIRALRRAPAPGPLRFAPRLPTTVPRM